MPNAIGGRLGRHDFASEQPTINARKILADCGIPVGANFFTLSPSTICRLLEWAGGYRKPRNANGSRGRYFHAKLQREAQRVTLSDARNLMKVAFDRKKGENSDV